MRQFLLFAACGGVGTVGHYAVLILLVELGAIDPVIATAFGFLVGAVINYFLNYSITFRSNQKHIVAGPRFLTIAVLGFFLNSTLMAILVHNLAAHYLPAQIATTLVVLLFNFFGNRLWTFRQPPAEQDK
jgi:putative flippase GtrA